MARMTSYIPDVDINDFSGGWNYRDAPSEVANNESPDMLNMTLDERGGVVKRLGYIKRNSSQLNSSEIKQSFYSKAIDRVIVRQGTSVYASTNGGSSYPASFKTFTTDARIGMCDFLGKLVMIHPVDGVFTYDGTTLAGPVANSPKGTMITPWQNRLFSAGDPTSASTSVRLTGGDVGALTWPASPKFVDIRVKDDAPITAIGAGDGMDEVGRAGLYVFKAESCYRVYDASDTATFGAYTVVDTDYGAENPACVASSIGLTAAISAKGIIVITAASDAAARVSDKIGNLFTPSQLNYAQLDKLCAGNYLDRFLFSLPRQGSSSNNLTLEFDPVVGWIAPHSLGFNYFSIYNKQDYKLLAASKTGGYLYTLFTGGTDDGSDITCRWQSRWFAPNRHNKFRLRRVRVSGRGTFTMLTKYNYTRGTGQSENVELTAPDVAYYNQGDFYNQGNLYGPTFYEDYQDFHSLGWGQAVSFEFQETGASTASGPPLLDDGSAPEVGAFAVYSLKASFVPLGVS